MFWRLLRGIFVGLGVIFFLMLVGIGGSIYLGLSQQPQPAPRMALVIDLGQPLAEQAGGGITDPLAGTSQRSVHDVIRAIDLAAEDDRVERLVLRFGGASPGMAHVLEIEQALDRYRAATGNPITAYADTYGEVFPANGMVMLASAADERVLMPAGMVSLTGVAAVEPFAGGMFQALGIDFTVIQREAYKTFPNILTEDGYTETHLEQTERLVADLSGQLVETLAENLELDPEQVNAALDRGPVLADQALETGLVTRLAYWDELADEIRGEDEAVELVSMGDFLTFSDPPSLDPRHIAVLTLDGPIAAGGAHDADGLRSGAILANPAAAQLEALADDPNVAAIVVRVDSPGGSAVASEVIRRAMEQAAAERPLIVSMGPAAASGGYWISMAADSIVATPATLTGSIGAFAAIPSFTPLLERIGITVGSVASHQNGTLVDPLTTVTEEERAGLEAIIDGLYRQFLQLVADARGMEVDAVRAVAQGQVWTGREALELGLVDQLGSLTDAIDLAAERAGVDADQIAIQRYPRPQTALEAALELVAGSASMADDLVALQPVLDGARPALEGLAPLLQRPGSAQAQLPRIQ